MGKLKCPHCAAKFNYAGWLRQHLAKIHKDTTTQVDDAPKPRTARRVKAAAGSLAHRGADLPPAEPLGNGEAHAGDETD